MQESQVGHFIDGRINLLQHKDWSKIIVIRVTNGQCIEAWNKIYAQSEFCRRLEERQTRLTLDENPSSFLTVQKIWSSLSLGIPTMFASFKALLVYLISKRLKCLNLHEENLIHRSKLCKDIMINFQIPLALAPSTLSLPRFANAWQLQLWYAGSPLVNCRTFEASSCFCWLHILHPSLPGNILHEVCHRSSCQLTGGVQRKALLWLCIAYWVVVYFSELPILPIKSQVCQIWSPLNQLLPWLSIKARSPQNQMPQLRRLPICNLQSGVGVRLIMKQKSWSLLEQRWTSCVGKACCLLSQFWQLETQDNVSVFPIVIRYVLDL